MSDVPIPADIGQSPNLSGGINHAPVGILGSGQLAMMLLEAAHHLQLTVHIFATSPDDKAVLMADSHIISDFSQTRDLHRFFCNVKTVIYENEWISPEILTKAIEGTPATMLPHPSTMAACGDKLRQKQLLMALGIPTSRFVYYSLGNSDTPEDWLQSLRSEFPAGCVLKWAKGGYDGKGTMLFLPEACKNGVPAKILDFVKQAVEQKVSVYAEQLVTFQQELALVTIRSEDSSCRFYPLVLTRQEDGVCIEVQGPAQAYGVASVVEQVAQSYALQIGNRLDLRGVFAIEFFQDENGQLLVNEIAPRVHNSGHFTLDGAVTSQFENHWRAVLGLPIGDTSCIEFFGMVNILGPENVYGTIEAPRLNAAQTVVHWYQKKDSRPGRKMGHINIFAANRAKFEQLMVEAHHQLKQWSQLWSSGPQR